MLGGYSTCVTNCLNFGNPYNPEVYYQFAHAIKGMGEACLAFETPVTGGNVSFYNQSDEGPVYPTPTIGMVGTMEDVSGGHMTMHFKEEGDQIFLLGNAVEDLGSSEYLYGYHKIGHSPAPYVNLEEEKQLQTVTLQLIEEDLISSAHDVSDGGLVVTLLESSFENGLGISIQTASKIRKDAFLYGEAGGRIVVSVKPGKVDSFKTLLENKQFPYLHLGEVSGKSLVIDGETMDTITSYAAIHEDSLGELIKG